MTFNKNKTLNKTLNKNYTFDTNIDTLSLSWFPFQYGYYNIENNSYSYMRSKLKPKLSFKFMIWQYTLSGMGELTINNKTYNIKPGYAMLLSNYETHKYRIHPNAKNWEFIYIDIKGFNACNFWDTLRKNIGPVVKFSKDSKTVNSAYEIIKSSLKETPTDPFTLSALAYNFSMNIANDTNFSNDIYITELEDKVKNFYLNSLSANLSVADVAEHLNYERSYFCRKFKAATGVAPSVYLQKIRIHQAEIFLKETKLNIKSIAEECGFSETSYFCKIFRKINYLSPSEYRAL